MPGSPPPSSEATIELLPEEVPRMSETATEADLEGVTPSSRGHASPPRFTPGDALGRYVILSRIGAGGMGVVYAAWDPKLDRKVALKLLLSDRPGHEQRLEREAQAMARLTHPNVIAVHDVGEVHGRVFLAMEFVEGQTLARWVAGEHEWRETFELVLGAGRGLAAAHAQGLIHRDFKPDNVMIDRDGRARVMDFGLVRASGPGSRVDSKNAADSQDSESRAESPAELAALASMDTNAFESAITRAGALMGTPAYMAPEQLRGEGADARSDQFTYCVTLWQCLYGARPFAGDSPLAVLFSISKGHFAEPSAGHGVPARIRRVLERGLASEASARWPNMDTLLASLVDDPAERRRPWIGAAVALGVALAAASAAIVYEPPAPPLPCAHAGEEIAADWSSAREAEIAALFEASALSYARETWAHTAPRLRDWATQWSAQRRDACEATQVRHEQSSELLDLRMACLDQRRSRFRALVEVLAEADDTVIEKTSEAIEGLPKLSHCGDREWLLMSARPPEDPELAAAVASLRGEVDRVNVRIEAGKGADLGERAAELETRALALDWPALSAHAAIAVGQIEQEKGRFEPAREAFERGYFAARRGADDEATVSAAFLLMYANGVGLAQFDAAERWTAHAFAEAERVGDPRLLAQVHISTGIQHYMRSDLEQAEASFARALALQSDEQSTDLAMANINYGTVIVRRDPARAQEAFAALDLGLTMLEGLVGSHHPVIAMTMSNYATVYGELERHAEAVELLERALEINLAAVGADHPFTGLIELNLAQNLAELDDPEPRDRALEYARSSARVHRASYGEQHQMVARSERVIAKIHLARAEPESALPHLDTATEIWTGLFGATHVDVLDTKLLRARALGAMNEAAEARTLLEFILAQDSASASLRADAKAELDALDPHSP